MSLSCCLLLFFEWVVIYDEEKTNVPHLGSSHQLELESPLSKYAAALLTPSLITQSYFHISKKPLHKQKRKRGIDGE